MMKFMKMAAAFLVCLFTLLAGNSCISGMYQYGGPRCITLQGQALWNAKGKAPIIEGTKPDSRKAYFCYLPEDVRKKMTGQGDLTTRFKTATAKKDRDQQPYFPRVKGNQLPADYQKIADISNLRFQYSTPKYASGFDPNYLWMVPADIVTFPIQGLAGLGIMTAESLRGN
jgi:hypothetical protein